MSEESKRSLGGNQVVTTALVVLLIGAAFMLGKLWTKVELLEKGGSQVAGTNTGAQPTTTAPSNDPAAGLAVDNLKTMAKNLGMDSDKFNKCLDDGKYAQKIKDDQAYGTKVGVSGTPTFFINDAMMVGAYPQQAFEDAIDFELAGGNWNKPTDKVKYLVDKDENNGEITLVKSPVETGKGYIEGKTDAKIKIVEFSDFQCPYCGKAYPTIKAIRAKYNDQVSVEFRHFPLSFHPYAEKAAEASECAGEQGKFWEMHNKMFDLQQS